MKPKITTRRTFRMECTLCGREIGQGERYWTINGSRVCQDCLLDYARMDYQACQSVRGKEAEYL